MAAHYRVDSTLGYKEPVDNDASLQHQSDRQRPSSDGRNAAPTSPQSTERIGQDLAHASSITNNAAGPSAAAASKKARVTLACKRCKRRKQRCDGANPCCRSCDRVGVACAYEKPMRPQYPGGKTLYISALEERIAFLEARMPDHAEDHFANNTSDNSAAVSDTIDESLMDTQARRRESSIRSSRNSMSDDTGVDDRSSLVDGVAYLSLCASGTTDATSEPYYVGSSSGATIARVIQQSIFKGAGNRQINEAAIATDQQYAKSTGPPTPPASAHSESLQLGLPDMEQARMLFDMFFERIHTRWPLLDRVVYEDLFAKQHIPGALTIVERSIFHLIYAITARFMSLTRKLHSVDSERHLMAATEPMDRILEQHSIATLQFLVLLGVHGQRSPYGAGAWSQIRYATSICIEMGLHRKPGRITTAEQAREAEIRRRIFWSCYSLDRATSIVLGRGFAISDKDINVELPSAGGQFWTLSHSEPRNPAHGPWSNVAPFIHMVKLDQINSRTHKAVFRVDRDVFKGTAEQRAKLDRKMSTIRADLDNWMRNCPQTPKDGNKTTWMYDPESAYLDARDFYGVQYHKAILSLFTIFLPTLETTDPRFITCAQSASAVCTAYKRLNQNRTLTYTMISLHSCFVAGLTLVYCIWRDRSLFSYDTLEATRDCSQSLTIFGEKWPGAVKYRDIFDALSGNLLKTVFDPRSAATFARNDSVQGNLAPSRSSQNQQQQPRAMQPRHLQPPIVPQTTDSTMSHMVSDAVKEAFLEVDGEAPGGWQGWRMWNEMVRDDSTLALDPASKSSSSSSSRGEGFGFSATAAEMSWDGFDGGMDCYSVDPVQDAALQRAGFEVVEQGGWEVGGFR